jgi:hypothetical protein
LGSLSVKHLTRHNFRSRSIAYHKRVDAGLGPELAEVGDKVGHQIGRQVGRQVELLCPT